MTESAHTGVLLREDLGLLVCFGLGLCRCVSICDARTDGVTNIMLLLVHLIAHGILCS